jgi:hypothetical protein
MKPDSADLPKSRTCAPLTAIRVVGLVLLSGSLAQNLEAQRTEWVRVAVTVQRDFFKPRAATNLSHPVASATTSSRSSRTAHDALIGAGVGAATGVVAAFIATHKASVTDHSEDSLAYIFFPAFGALIGLVVGGIVGFLRN